MITHFQKSHPVLVSSCVLGCLLAAPSVAQTPSPVVTQTSAPTGNTKQIAPSARADIPIWLPMAAILGSVFGLTGMGLAAWVLIGKNKTDNLVAQINEQQTNLNKEMPQLRARIPGPNDVERFVCVQLGSKYDEIAPPGYSIVQAINDKARNQATDYASQELEPKLQAVESMSGETRDGLHKFSAHFNKNADEVKSELGDIDNRTADLQAKFAKLDNETRAELEAIVFNIYNLIFTQSEGDSVVPKLERDIQRYQKLLDSLRTIAPDEMTRLTLREFEEALGKLDNRLQSARQALSEARKVEVESLPYLDESERAQAGKLLEERRKQLRGGTAGAKESINALRDTVIELYKPLQTLWMGASVEDVDQPERTRRYRALLEEVKSIFAVAELQIYQAQIGEEIDPAMVKPTFAGQPHEAPLIVQKVTKLGLKVEERIEQGAVVVA